MRGVADEVSVDGEPADGRDGHDQHRDPGADLAEAVAGHQAEAQAALGGDNAHDAGENRENGAGDQNGPDHMVEGKTDADRAAGLHARDDEHIAQRDDQHGKKGLACGRGNGSFTVFIRSGFYSNILFSSIAKITPFISFSYAFVPKNPGPGSRFQHLMADSSHDRRVFYKMQMQNLPPRGYFTTDGDNALWINPKNGGIFFSRLAFFRKTSII